MALIGQWRYSVITDKLAATMQIANRLHSLTQKQNDPPIMIGGCIPLAITPYFLDDFETGQKYTTRGLQIWRSGVQSPVEEVVDVPAVS